MNSRNRVNMFCAVYLYSLLLPVLPEIEERY